MTFKDGSTYVYEGVPQHIADHFFRSDSPGRYLRSTIQNYYTTRKL